MYRLNLLGCGNMGEAILSGIVQSGKLGEESIAVYDKDKKRRAYIRDKYPLVMVYESMGAMVFSAYTILAVKPQDLSKVVGDMLGKNMECKKLISIVAGVPTSYFEKKLGKIGVIRVMPNTPALVRKGVFVLSRGRYARKGDMDFASSIMESLGRVIIVEERYQNLSTALSGSGPAYFFLFSKYMIDAAVEEGMDYGTAKKLVSETMAGSAELIRESGLDIGNLISMVASRGGTTEKALEVFEQSGLSKIVESAVQAALKRAHELENLLDS